MSEKEIIAAFIIFIKSVGIIEFTNLLTEASKNKEDLLINASNLWQNLKDNLTKDQRKDFLLFIKTIIEEIIKENIEKENKNEN